MSQPSPTSAKKETNAVVSIKKEEPIHVATKSQAISATIQAQPAPPTLKAQIELDTTVLSTKAKDSPVTAEHQLSVQSTVEISATCAAPLQETAAVKDKVTTMKVGLSRIEPLKTEDSVPNLSKVKAETHITSSSHPPVTDTTAVSTSPVAGDIATDGVGQSKEKRPEMSTDERGIQKPQPDDDLRLTEPTKSLQQCEMQPESQEPHLDADKAPVSKDLPSNQVEEVTDITSSVETQLASTKNIINVRTFF